MSTDSGMIPWALFDVSSRNTVWVLVLREWKWRRRRRRRKRLGQDRHWLIARMQLWPAVHAVPNRTAKGAERSSNVQKSLSRVRMLWKEWVLWSNVSRRCPTVAVVRPHERVWLFLWVSSRGLSLSLPSVSQLPEESISVLDSRPLWKTGCSVSYCPVWE